jgi:hypothetical protein
MATCYTCRGQVNRKNQSWEHIIPSALGGSLRSRRILCKSCNEKAGASIDQALVNFCRPQLEKYAIRPDRTNTNKHWLSQGYSMEMVDQAIQKISKNFYAWLFKPDAALFESQSQLQPLQIVKELFPEKPLHLVFLQTHKEAEWITGYVELFGEHGFLTKFKTAAPYSDSKQLLLLDPQLLSNYVLSPSQTTRLLDVLESRTQAAGSLFF